MSHTILYPWINEKLSSESSDGIWRAEVTSWILLPLCHVSICQRPGKGKPFEMVSSFQTSTSVTAIAWDSCSCTNPNQNALVIGCCDGSVVLHQPTLNASQFIIKKVSTPTTEVLRDLTRKWKAERKCILFPCLCHSNRMGFTLVHKPQSKGLGDWIPQFRVHFWTRL